MKNIVLVTKQGTALALGENVSESAVATNSTIMASLEVLKSLLANIEKSDVEVETTNIFVPDSIQAITNGGAIEYIKTGKNLSGKQLSDEEVGAFREIYQMFAERILNVRFSMLRFIKKDDKDLQALKSKAYDALDANMGTGVVETTTVVDPDKDMREMLDAKIKECLANNDLDTMKELMAMRKGLAEPQVVKTSTKSSARPNRTFSTGFDSVSKEADEIEEQAPESLNIEDYQEEVPEF